MNTRRSYDGLWRERLDAFVKAWPAFQRGDVKALHQVRIASRRIREALPIVAADASRSKVRKLNKKVRAVTRALGPVRELDVQLGMIEAGNSRGALSGRALVLVRRAVASQRRVLREELAGRDVVDLDRLVKKLERLPKTSGHRGEESEASRGTLAARLLRRAKSLKAAVDETGPLYVPEPLHAVRVAAKKMRYVLEVAHEAGYAGAAAEVKALKRHQDRLGELHDLQLLLHRVREVGSSSEGGARLSDLAAYGDSIAQECSRLHAEFLGNRDAILNLTKDVRERLVPSLTTPRLRAARAKLPRKRGGGRSRAG